MSDPERGFRQLMIMGHRGAREIVPENTLAAYGLAIQAGVDAIEIDVHLTRDGELAVMHDAGLERTTDGSGAIHEFTLAELKLLNAAAKHEGDVDYGVQRVPALQDVYDFVQGKVQINIEIKTNAGGKRYPGIERKVVDVVRANNAVDYTIISSFDFPTLADIGALAPEITRYAIVSHEYFRSKGAGAAEALVSELTGLGLDWVAVNKAYVTPELVQLMQRHGKRVHAWVINEVPEMWSCVEMGIDYITTDRPDRLIPAYRARQSASQAG